MGGDAKRGALHRLVLDDPEHSAGDWLWVMDIHQRFDPEAYVSFLLPNLLTHFHTSVVLRALGEYEPPTADEDGIGFRRLTTKFDGSMASTPKLARLRN